MGSGVIEMQVVESSSELSSQEEAVANLIKKGLGAVDIATDLKLSVGAARSHIRAIANKVLSEREIEVAKVAVNGLTNQEIGDILGIGADTVKVHLRSIFRKMGISRRNYLLEAFPPQRVFTGQKPENEADIRLLDAIAAGATDANIADLLKVPISEVHTDVARLRRETGISSRNELAMWWMVETKMVEQSEQSLPTKQCFVIEHRGARTRKARTEHATA